MTDVNEPATVAVALQLLDPDLPAPEYARAGDAGADLRARHDVELAPGERALVDNEVAVAVPPGYVGLVHPRSGLAAKHGITVVNAPGTVDSGYRGELKVCLLNTDARESYSVRRGERIAQLLIQEVATARFETVAELPSSERGARGFGSSGTH